MGIIVYPVVEKSVEWSKFESAGKPLAKVIFELDKMAKKNKFCPLFDFYCLTEEQAIADILGGDPDDPSTYDKNEVPEELWFETDEALKTIDYFLQCVQRNSHRYENPEHIIEDLKEFKRILNKAKEEGIRWHLGQSV